MAKHHHTNCEYHQRNECIPGCRHQKEQCALYALTQNYNATHKLNMTPIEVLIAKIENRHFNDLEEVVILKALGLTNGKGDLR